MKGFVKILEAIIACIILLASLSYFFTSYLRPSGWSDSVLKLEAQDALLVLDKTGEIQNFIKNNESGLEERLTKMFPETTGFSITISGIPKSKILIACVCSDEEYLELKKMLMPGTRQPEADLESGGAFLLNGRKIELNIDKKDANNFDLNRADVLVFFDYNKLSGEISEINKFIERGGGIVAITNLTESDIAGIFNTIFNLSWSSSDGGVKSVFNDLENPENVSYKISDYFVSVPFRVDTSEDHEGEFYIHGNSYTIGTYYNETGEYAIFDGKFYRENDVIYPEVGVPVKIVRINANVTLPEYESVDLSIINSSYWFNTLGWDSTTNKIAKDEKTILASGDLSSVKANYYISRYGKGRAVWIADYNKNQTDTNQLLKAIMLWVSGEEFVIGDKNLPKRYISVSRIITDGSNLYTVSLLMWYMFY